jgi:hypothetical protein
MLEIVEIFFPAREKAAAAGMDSCLAGFASLNWAARSATVIDPPLQLEPCDFFTETMRFRSEFQIPAAESTRPRRGIARIGMKTGRNTFKIHGLLEAAGGDARSVLKEVTPGSTLQRSAGSGTGKKEPGISDSSRRHHPGQAGGTGAVGAGG